MQLYNFLQYVNTGAGGISGIFIHDRHADSDRFRLTGWWGHKMESRFTMNNGNNSVLLSLMKNNNKKMRANKIKETRHGIRYTKHKQYHSNE